MPQKIKREKRVKIYAIVWKDTFPFTKNLGVKAGDVISVHLEKPIITLEKFWEVVEGEFIIKKK